MLILTDILKRHYSQEFLMFLFLCIFLQSGSFLSMTIKIKDENDFILNLLTILKIRTYKNEQNLN